MAKKKQVHVTPHEEGGWKVTKDGRTISRHDTKAPAEKAARETARNNDAETVIHGKDGRIQRKDSSGGNDPHPPKDKR